MADGFNATDNEYAGTHELGHVINSLLLKQSDEKEANKDWINDVTADNMVYMALRNPEVLPEEKRGEIYWRTDEKERGLKFRQIDYKKSDLHKLGLTSVYGGSSAAEFVAEAFADVYAHGTKARPASIELLKRYVAVRGQVWKDHRKVQKQLNKGKKKDQP